MENTNGEREGLVTQAGEPGDRVGELTRQVARLEARLRESHHKLARAESRLASMEASNSMRFGRAVADALHHPGHGIVSVPMELARMWRARRRGEDRVVPIALPAALPAELPGAPSANASTAPSAPAARELITMTLPSDLRVPRTLAYHGLTGYEPEGLACFLAAADVAGPGAVLDIGANVGIYAALAAALTGREVRAFEPMPSLVDAARRFAAENQLRFTTELLALGAENGSARLYLSSNSDTSNSLAAGFRDSSHQIEVPVETLDSYAARTGLVPAIMKVDTETTEPDVLAGAAATIREHRPWILCEVLAGRVEERLTEVLAPFRYHWYHVTGEIPYEPADKIAGDESYTNLMWLFAPEEPGEAFWAALRAWTAGLAECTPERGAQLRSREIGTTGGRAAR